MKAVLNPKMLIVFSKNLLKLWKQQKICVMGETSQKPAIFSFSYVRGKFR